MKIKCQEHYDKVAEYAKSIGDTTFQNCIERLKQWEKNSGGRYEIELYYDFAPYSFGFAERTPDGRNGIVGGLLYHGKMCIRDSSACAIHASALSSLALYRAFLAFSAIRFLRDFHNRIRAIRI